MNYSTNQKQTHRHREQTCSCQGGWSGGGLEGEAGVSRCKLLHIEWRNKDLLYSTGGYSQYPMIDHSGEEYFKKGIPKWSSG